MLQGKGVKLQIGKKINDFLIDLYFFGRLVEDKAGKTLEFVNRLIAKNPAINTFLTSFVPLNVPKGIGNPILIGYMFLHSLGTKADSISEEELKKEFKEYVESISKDLNNMKSYVEACGIDYLPRILTMVERKNKDKDIEDFLKGLGPAWNIMIDSIDIKRNEENEIREKLKDNKNVLLLGNSGAGKSVLLKRLAYDLIEDYGAFFSTGTVDSIKVIEFIKEYSPPDKRTIIIIDNILAHEDAIKDLMERVRDISLDVNFVLSEQTEKWQKENLSILNFETVRITLDEETEKQYIERYSEIKHKIFSEKEKDNMISTSKGVFPILVLLTSGDGKSLDKVIDDMYRAIENDEREIMKAILFSASYGVEIPEELIRSAHNDGAIINNLNDKGLIRIGNGLISTQHPFIAKRILEDKFRLNKADEERIINNLIKVEGKREYYDFFFSLGTMMRKDKKDSAELLLKKAIMISPQSSGAHFNLGNLLSNSKRYDEAEKEYREAIKIDPNLAEGHSNLGNLLSNSKRYDEAEKECREAIRIDPDDAYAHNNLGNLLDDLKRYDEAEKEYREAIKINPNFVEVHNNLGNLLDKLKRFDETEKEYREAIKIDPNDAKAHYNLGNLLKDLKRDDEAEKEYREATKIDPNYAYAHNNLGVLLYQSDRYDEAEKECREAIRINPNYAEGHNNLGALLDNLKCSEEAEKELREAIRIDPDYAGAHYNLGNLLDNLKRYDEAEKELREAIWINPDYAKAHYNLGNLLKGLKHFDEAEKEYKEAIRINPDFADAHYNLGVLLKDLKRFDEAEKEYKEAIRIDPDHAKAHANLGVLLLNTEKKSEAKQEILKAIKLFEKQGNIDGVKKCDEILKGL